MKIQNLFKRVVVAMLLLMAMSTLLLAGCGTTGDSENSGEYTANNTVGEETYTVKTTNLSFNTEEKDIVEVQKFFESKVNEFGGNISNGKTFARERWSSMSLTIEISTEKLDEFIKTLKANEKLKLYAEETEFYSVEDNQVDLTAQKTALKAERDKLQEYCDKAIDTLGTSSGNVDIVSITEKIRIIEEEIEKIDNKIKKSEGLKNYAKVRVYVSSSSGSYTSGDEVALSILLVLSLLAVAGLVVALVLTRKKWAKRLQAEKHKAQSTDVAHATKY